MYVIKSKDVDEECKNPSDLFKKGILDLNKLLSTAEKVDKDYYDEVNEKEKNSVKNKEEGVHKHVQIAEQVMQEINIRYYKGDFYIYENGVYIPFIVVTNDYDGKTLLLRKEILELPRKYNTYDSKTRKRRD